MVADGQTLRRCHRSTRCKVLKFTYLRINKVMWRSEREQHNMETKSTICIHPNTLEQIQCLLKTGNRVRPPLTVGMFRRAPRVIVSDTAKNGGELGVAHHSVSRITWDSVTKAFSSGRYNGSVLYRYWSLLRTKDHKNTP